MTENTNQPIGWIKFWTPKDDWYSINSDERKRYYADYEKVFKQIIEKGARLIGVYKCRGQSPWSRFEVWEFPDVSFVIDFSNELEEIGHFQYFEEDHTIGRKYDRGTDPENWVV
jgi:hypothetical protein